MLGIVVTKDEIGKWKEWLKQFGVMLYLTEVNPTTVSVDVKKNGRYAGTSHFNVREE